MADITIDADVQSVAYERTGIWGPFYISPTVAAEIFIDGNADVAARKTADKGATWAAKQVVVAGNVVKLHCFFDRGVPGDSGNLVHCVWLDTAGGGGSEDWFYANYNVSTGAWSGVVTIDGTLTMNGNNKLNYCFILKCRNGDLISGHVEKGIASGCELSDDGGATWGAIANPYEGDQTDETLGFPANVDAGDAALLFWDFSASAISVKMFDKSLNTWTETAILAGMTAPPEGFYQSWSGRVRDSDGLIFACAWNDYDVATADLVTFTVNPNNIGAPPIDTTTDPVVENLNESVQASMIIDQQNGDVYVAICEGGAWTGTLDITYFLSGDWMASWGVSQPFSEAGADDNRRVSSGGTIGNSGGQVQWSWFNDDLNDAFTNLVNAIEVPAVGGLTPRSYPRGETRGVMRGVA